MNNFKVGDKVKVMWNIGVWTVVDIISDTEIEVSSNIHTIIVEPDELMTLEEAYESGELGEW